VELCIDHEKSVDEWGYVFERVGYYAERGYKPGVIYLPRDLPHQPYKPGLTLADTIRHEYAHAWYYLDPGFFRQEWFSRTFGAAYWNCSAQPYDIWLRQMNRDPDFQAGQQRRCTPDSRSKHFSRQLMSHFVTEYAATNASEDFAETFMFFLKYRRSLQRFSSRPTVYKKLRMVERAVAMAARRARSRSMRLRSA
jgi:hypothetical protein